MTTVYIFDYDGVIADPFTHELDERVLEHIAELLKAGHFVSFNTGRALVWFEQYILPGFEAAGVTPEHFTRLVISTEKGGEYTEFVDGKPHSVLSDHSITPEIMAKAHAVYDSIPGIQDVIFWREKQTMATASKLAHVPMDEYLQVKFVLEDKLAAALQTDDVRLDSIVNAVDIQAKGASKYHGTKLIYEWVARHTDIRDCRFICLGDSKSDYEMTLYPLEQGRQTTFVFTGESLQGIDVDPRLEVIKPEGLYTQAALNFLRN